MTQDVNISYKHSYFSKKYMNILLQLFCSVDKVVMLNAAVIKSRGHLRQMPLSPNTHLMDHQGAQQVIAGQQNDSWKW